jgi:hypothetical protein
MKKITIFVVIWMLTCLIPMNVIAAQTTITEQDTFTVNSVGDINMKWVIDYPTDIYTSICTQYKANTYLLVRELIGYKTASEIKNPTVSFDDMYSKVTVSLTLLGGAINKGDHWEANMASDVIYVNKQGATVTFTETSATITSSGQLTITATIIVKLPSNAKDITYDSSSHTLKYVLPKDFVSENRNLTIGLLATGMIVCVILLAYTMIKGRGVSMKPGRARAAPRAYAPFEPAGGTKFCMSCAAKIPRAAKVCPECGARQE